jgi:hypothetical protein
VPGLGGSVRGDGYVDPMSAVADPQELNGDEFREALERRVEETLSMTLDELVEALRAGTIDPESPAVAGLAILVAPRAR